MKRFFTSDFHLGSTNIIKYCNRPFSSTEEMTTALVDNCNKIAKKEDTIFHCGDFLLRGSDSHDLITGKDESRLLCGLNDIKRDIYASLVLLNGNHDSSNCEADFDFMTLSLNQNYHNVTVSHYPSYHEMYRYVGNGNRNTFNGIHVHLCGHVHVSWLFMYDWQKNVLNINVGCDVWNYMPVSDVQLTELLDYLRSYLFTKFTCKEDFKMDREHFDLFVKAKTLEVKEAREKRHAEKLAKKGVTPEEAERRKIAAMKVKGLV